MSRCGLLTCLDEAAQHGDQMLEIRQDVVRCPTPVDKNTLKK